VTPITVLLEMHDSLSRISKHDIVRQKYEKRRGLMSQLVDSLRDLDYRQSDLGADILIADIADEPFEVRILFYKKGTSIPAHTHSTSTLHIVLEGELEVESDAFDGPKSFKAGAKYECGQWEYRAPAVSSDTFVMLIQQPGTKILPK
jgi:mannose-6-phosphate isomerase-like protein (cupin superfamily)